ncbi:MAG: hypothetical protein AAGF24_09220, partial [Cyanobacteria bacterium P01_H01_bin.121]
MKGIYVVLIALGTGLVGFGLGAFGGASLGFAGGAVVGGVGGTAVGVCATTKAAVDAGLLDEQQV